MMRLHLRRRRRLGQDEGYTLVVVMLISTLVLIMLSTAITALNSGIRPNASSRDDGKALSAAEAAIEDFIKYANDKCASSLVGGCAYIYQGLSSPSTWPADPTTTRGTRFKTVNATGTGMVDSDESYLWQVLYTVGGRVRLKVIGQYPTNAAATQFRTKTLIADVRNSANFNDFQYFTHFETVSPTYIQNLYYPNRKVTLDSNLPNDNSFQVNSGARGTVTWNGVPSSETDICNQLYNQRQPLIGAHTPYAGTDFSWYNEGGSFVKSSGSSQNDTTLNHWETCDVVFEREMGFNGPLYTQDKFVVDSNTNNCGYNGNRSDGTSNNGPVFNDAAGQTSLSYSVQAAVQGDYRTTATYDPSQNLTAGYAGGTEGCVFPQHADSLNPLDLKDGNLLQSLFLGAAQCVYTGPTRIFSRVESGQTYLYVTSPNTPADNSSACYTNYNPNSVTAPTLDTVNPSGGVAQARIPVPPGGKPLIYVKNPSSWTPRTPSYYQSLALPLTRTPVFDLRGTTSPPAPAPDTGTLTGTWTVTPYSSTSPCPSPANGANERTFDCDNTQVSPAPDVFTAIKTRLTTLLNSETGTSDNNTQFQAKLQDALSPTGSWPPASSSLAPGVSWSTATPVNGNKNDVVYSLTITQTPSSSTVSGTVPALPVSSGNNFFQKTPGVADFTRNNVVYSVTVKRNVCTKNGGCNSASDWANNPPVQFTSTNINHYYDVAAAGNRNPRVRFPWVGTNNYQAPTDITPYDPTAGDAYVEGTVKRAGVEVVADNDIYITNQTSYDAGDPPLTDGWAFIAGEYIHVYRPVACLYNDASNTTTTNWCPDDLTGADTTPGEGQWSSQYPPSTVYTTPGAAGWPADPVYGTPGSLATGKTNNDTTNLYGTFFAMGYTDPSASSRRGGSFMVDNVARGPDNGVLVINGGLYQYHRGVTKLGYLLHDNAHRGNIARSGMTFHYTYDNMEDSSGRLRVAQLPLPEGASATGHKWSLVGISLP